MNRSQTSLLPAAAVFGGLVLPDPPLAHDIARASVACPSCKRGKLQGKDGKRYCQRCSWFEAGEKERGMPAWLFKTHELDKAGKHDDALDLLFWEVDEHYRRNQFEKLNALLGELRLSEMSTTLLVGVLSTTHVARSRLPARAKLTADIEALLVQREPGRADALMKGLR